MQSEPDEEWNREAHNLRREFLEQRFIFRVFLVIILLVSIIGGLGGGFLLAHEVHYWAAWAFSLLFLEPVGLASLLALVSLAAPDSLAAHLFGSTFRRASRAAFAGLFAYLVVIIALFVYALLGAARS